jgi:CheY-like chemotaxis protein
MEKTPAPMDQDRKLRILISEDEPEMRDLLRITLGNKGFEIRTASTGPEAVTIASEFVPDLILMDIRMPGEFDGVEATRRIKSNPDLSTTVVIGQTAVVELSEVKQNLRAGFDDYLGKPYLPIDVIDAISRFFPEAI